MWLGLKGLSSASLDRSATSFTANSPSGSSRLAIACRSSHCRFARDAGVARRTVVSYFQILTDTLLGSFLPAWKLKTANRQVVHSKFHFFDPGVARTLSGRLPYPPLPEETGFLLETLVLGELRAFVSYRGLHYPLHYWRTYSGTEVDFLCETATGFVAVEVKASRRWERRFLRGLARRAGARSAPGLLLWGLSRRPGSPLGANRGPAGREFLRRLRAGDLIA